MDALQLAVLGLLAINHFTRTSLANRGALRYCYQYYANENELQNYIHCAESLRFSKRCLEVLSERHR